MQTTYGGFIPKALLIIIRQNYDGSFVSEEVWFIPMSIPSTPATYKLDIS
jgi:hypothetical protein